MNSPDGIVSIIFESNESTSIFFKAETGIIASKECLEFSLLIIGKILLLFYSVNFINY